MFHSSGFRVFQFLVILIFFKEAAPESCFNTECYPAPLPYPKNGCQNSDGYTMQNMWPCSGGKTGWTYFCCKYEPEETGVVREGGPESGIPHHGEATWYEILGFLACGTQHKDSEMIAAIGINYWTKSILNPNKDPICGRRAKVTNDRNGKSVTVTIRDKCYGCGEGNLDLSPAAFEALGESRGVGRFEITWSLL